MNCNACEPLISPYLDGELEPDQMNAVEMHLASCEQCSESAQTIEFLTGGATELDPVTPGADVIMKTCAAIRNANPEPHHTTFGPVMDVDELMEYLHIDQETLELYVEELPFFELGGKLLFRTQSIDQWIQRREQLAGLTSQRGSAVSVADKEGGVSWTL